MAKELTWHDRCKKCGKLDETTKRRTFKTANYLGPCGDSFCYHSCDSSSCFPTTAEICDNCEKELKK